jgi:O-antigen/teichoic acid export membrane protein
MAATPMLRRILAHPLFTRIGWRLSLDLVSRGSFVLLNFLIARRLGVEEFGRFGYAVSLALMFQVATEFGTSLFMIKELGQAESARKTELWTDYAQLKVFLSLSVLLISLPLSLWLWRWPQPWLFWLAMLAMIGNSFFDFLQFVSSGLGRLDLARVHILLHRGGLLLTVLAVVVLRPTLAGILTAMGLAGVGLAAISVGLFYRSLGLSFRRALRFGEWRRILRHSYALGAAGLLGNGYLRIGVVILTWLAGPLLAGYYGAAFRIFELSFVLPAAVMVMAVPHLASIRARETGPRLSREVLRLGRVMAALGGAFALVMGLAAPWLIRVIYGDDFRPAVPILRLLSLCSLMVYLNYFVTNLMVVFDRQRTHARNELICFVVSIPVYLALSRLRPGLGTAAGLLGIEILLFSLTLVSLRVASKVQRIVVREVGVPPGKG